MFSPCSEKRRASDKDLPVLVASRLLLVDAVVSSLENSEFVEEVMLCEKKVTHLIIKKLK